MLQQHIMKIQEYHKKRARYDPIAWSRCNICKEKYPNDEIFSHIHQKHPEKDCSTFSCWTCGIRFRKEAQMKRHMKTVKHELEAKKFIIPDEEPVDDKVHLVLIDRATDMSQLWIQLNPADFITNVQPLNSSEIKEMNPPNNMTLQVSTNKETPLLMDHQNLVTRKNSPNLMTHNPSIWGQELATCKTTRLRHTTLMSIQKKEIKLYWMTKLWYWKKLTGWTPKLQLKWRPEYKRRNNKLY